MKKLITILLLCLLSFITKAQTTYHVATDGSGDFTTIAQVNAATFSAGDQILFKRGDTFYGTIIVHQSGTSGNPITYGAYGTGAKPIITGFTTVTSWTNLGGNIWESTSAVSSLGSCNMVLVNGKNTAMGRWPNTGYLNIDSHSGNTSITSSSLTGTPDWTGAKIADRRQSWFTEVDSITSQSGSTINITGSNSYNIQTNWGFFIEASASTLDQQNEWYYNPSTGKIRIYSTTTPTNVQVATVESLITDAGNYPYNVIDNLNLIGANNAAVDMSFAPHSTVTNCDISFIGEIGIYFDGTTPVATGNTLTDIGYTGIQADQNCTYGIITNNTIKRVCPFAGTAVRGGGSAVYAVMPNGNIQYNSVDSSGWGGINVYGNNDTAQNNFVNHSALIREDCAGVATHHGYTGVQILNNIILNTIGAPDGTNAGNNKLAHGIYLDDLSNYVTVSGNTVAGCSGAGIILHRTDNNTITGNTFYNNNYSQSNFTKGQIWVQNTDTPAFAGNVIKRNILFPINANQSIWNWYSSPANIQATNDYGTSDSNYYTNVAASYIVSINSGGTTNNYTLPGWKTYTSQDAHSVNGVFTNTRLFVYNPTDHDSIVSLANTYQDVKGVNYNSGSITLAAYSSAVLLQTGSLTAAPTISMSGNQTIAIDSTGISAAPSWASGHSGTVAWTQDSGPNTATIRSPNSASTEVAGLINGTYVFRCTIMQDDGQTAYGEVTVMVETPSQIIKIATRGRKIFINLN